MREMLTELIAANQTAANGNGAVSAEELVETEEDEDGEPVAEDVGHEPEPPAESAVTRSIWSTSPRSASGSRSPATSGPRRGSHTRSR